MENERKITMKASSILQRVYYILHSAPTYVCLFIGLSQHLHARVADQAVETQLEEPEGETDQPALAGLLVCASVANSVCDSRHDPAGTEDA